MMTPGDSLINWWERGIGYATCAQADCENLVYGKQGACCPDCAAWRIAFYLIYDGPESESVNK